MKKEIFKEMVGAGKSVVGGGSSVPGCHCLSKNEEEMIMNYGKQTNPKCAEWCCFKVKGYGYRIAFFCESDLNKDKYCKC